MLKTLIISILLNLLLLGVLAWVYFSPREVSKEETALKTKIEANDMAIKKVYDEGCRCRFENGKIIFTGEDSQ